MRRLIALGHLLSSWTNAVTPHTTKWCSTRSTASVTLVHRSNVLTLMQILLILSSVWTSQLLQFLSDRAYVYLLNAIKLCTIILEWLYLKDWARSSKGLSKSLILGSIYCPKTQQLRYQSSTHPLFTQSLNIIWRCNLKMEKDQEMICLAFTARKRVWPSFGSYRS